MVNVAAAAADGVGEVDVVGWPVPFAPEHVGVYELFFGERGGHVSDVLQRGVPCSVRLEAYEAVCCMSVDDRMRRGEMCLQWPCTRGASAANAAGYDNIILY